MQLLAEAGAGKDLNEQRLELVRSVLIAANAQRLQAKPRAAPIPPGLGGWGGEQAWEDPQAPEPAAPCRWLGHFVVYK